MKKLLSMLTVTSFFVSAFVFATPAVSPTSFTAKDLGVMVFPAPEAPDATKLTQFCSDYMADARANCPKTPMGKINPNLCNGPARVLVGGMEYQVNHANQGGLEANLTHFCGVYAPMTGQSVPDCVTDSWTLMNDLYDHKCGWL